MPAEDGSQPHAAARVLILGDIIGRSGRRALATLLPGLRRERGIALVVANGENLAGGFGLTEGTAREVFAAGVDVLTAGNHIWDRPESLPFLAREPRILRPYNVSSDTPGQPHVVVTAGGLTLAVLSLVGQVFMSGAGNPFTALDCAWRELRGTVQGMIVDFHAEATSEKMALAAHADGRIAVLAGTHTHVPTADARILPGGTAYISDVGMTGAYDSVIGMTKKSALPRFLTGATRRLEVATACVRLHALQVDLDGAGRPLSLETIVRPLAEGEDWGADEAP